MSEEHMYTSLSVATLGPATLPKNNGHRDLSHCQSTETFSSSHSKKSLFNKPDFHSTGDIEGAAPKPTKNPNYQSKVLVIDDIEGTRARVRDRMHLTSRSVNPLNPEYKLPSYPEPEPYVPKFLRDTLEIDDIEGTRTKQKLALKERQTMNVNDIDGAQACWRPRHAKARLEAEPHSVMELCERQKKIKFQDRTTRDTNIVEPVYYIHGDKIADDMRSKPRKPKPYIADNHLLQTRDIPGATAGDRGSHLVAIPDELRREFRNTNYLGDIPGAQADTVKHAIRTSRKTNPLNPHYQSLDGEGQVLHDPIDPLLPNTIIKVPTLRPTKSTPSLEPISAGAPASTFQNPVATSHSYSIPSDIKSYADKFLDTNDLLGSTSASSLNNTQQEDHPHSAPHAAADFTFDFSGTSGISKPPSGNFTKGIAPVTSTPSVSQPVSRKNSKPSASPSPALSRSSTPRSNTSAAARRAMDELEAEIRSVREL